MIPMLSQYLYNAFHHYWDYAAFSDYTGEDYSYKNVAEQIVKFHVLFIETGIKPGDKIAICGANSSKWAIAFLACITYGGVAIPLLHEYTTTTLKTIIKHCECKLLFVSEIIWKSLNWLEVNGINVVISLSDFRTLYLSKKATEESNEQDVSRAISLKQQVICRGNILSWIHQFNTEELVTICYTSGTTAPPKGVMIPARALSSNISFGIEAITSLKAGDDVISMLPLAHSNSLTFEFLSEFVLGVHIHFLPKTQNIDYTLASFKRIRPKLILLDSYILEKIVRKLSYSVLEKKYVRLLRNFQISRAAINKLIKKKMVSSFGGNFYEIVAVGMALNKEVDSLLYDIRFPYTIGYGMTECAPIIGYSDWKTYKTGSCGKAVPQMQVIVDDYCSDSDSAEILVKGDNVMLGYYKDSLETSRTIDVLGWLHTGDLGCIDKEGNIYIKGRCKTKIVAPSGQNIYPEEIEQIILSYPYIREALVVERERKLCALVYPEFSNKMVTQALSCSNLTRSLQNFRNDLAKNGACPPSCDGLTRPGLTPKKA